MITRLEEVAPVYQFTLRGGDRAKWSQRVDEVADAVNRTEKLDALDAELSQEQQHIADEDATAIKGTTIGVISSFEDNTAYLWGGDNMLGTLYKPLGFEWSADEDAVVAKKSQEAAEKAGTAGKPGKVEPEA